MIRLLLIFMLSFSFLQAKTQFRTNHNSDSQFEVWLEDLLNGDINSQIYAVSNLRKYKTKIPLRTLTQIFNGRLGTNINISVKTPYLKMRILKIIRMIDNELATPELIKSYQVFIQKVEKDDKADFYKVERDEPMVLVCGEILRTIAALPYNQEADKLIQSSLNHPNAYIQESAIQAVRLLNKKENVGLLTEKLQNAENPVLQANLLHSILFYNHKNNEYLDQVYKLLQHKRYDIRIRAAQTIKDLNLVYAIPYLQDAIIIEEDDLTKKEMLLALRTINDLDLTPSSALLVE